MTRMIPGRFTAQMDEPFVVFLIGMRINRLLAFNKWILTIRAMPPMLKELYQHPEKGFLGGEFFPYWRGPAVLQYWRSYEELERFARTHTSLPGAASTSSSAPTGASASGTKPT